MPRDPRAPPPRPGAHPGPVARYAVDRFSPEQGEADYTILSKGVAAAAEATVAP